MFGWKFTVVAAQAHKFSLIFFFLHLYIRANPYITVHGAESGG